MYVFYKAAIFFNTLLTFMGVFSRPFLTLFYPFTIVSLFLVIGKLHQDIAWKHITFSAVFKLLAFTA